MFLNRQTSKCSSGDGRVNTMSARRYDDDDGRPRRPVVSTEFLERNGVCRVDADEAHRRIGYRAAGTLIPYRHFFAPGPVVVNGKEFCRLRLDQTSSKGVKYLAPKYCGAQLYIPSSPPFSSADLVVCEGEFKSLSLCESGVRAVAIGGINSGVPHGELLPSLAKLVKKMPFKRIFFLGDGDTAFRFAFVLEAIKLARVLERLRPSAQLLPLFRRRFRREGLRFAVLAIAAERRDRLRADGQCPVLCCFGRCSHSIYFEFGES